MGRTKGRRQGYLRQKASGRWEISAEGPPDATGRRRRKYRVVPGGRRDAERELARLVVELAEGQTVAAAGTFAELADQWWRTKAELRWADATAIRHRQDLDTHLLPRFGRRKVDTLKAGELTELYSEMSARGLSPRTVQHCAGTARALLNWAVRQGLLGRNPADAAEVPVRPRRAYTLPTADQISAVLELAAADPFWHAWFRVAMGTGARPAEVCALRWNDLDLEHATLCYDEAIGRALLEDGRVGWRVKGTKTSGEKRTGVRTVAIDLATSAALRRWRAVMVARALELGQPLAPELYVFPGDIIGRRSISPSTPSRRWRAYALEAGVAPAVRLYDASRHYHVSWCIGAGFSVPEIALRVGNSADMIWRTYAHALTSDGRNIADAIDAAARMS